MTTVRSVRPEGSLSSAGVTSPLPDAARDPVVPANPWAAGGAGGAKDEDGKRAAGGRVSAAVSAGGGACPGTAASGGRGASEEREWSQQVKEMGRRMERVERIVELVLESVRGRTASDGVLTETLSHHHSHHHHRGSRAESPSRADKWRNLAQDSLWKTHGPQKRSARGGRGERREQGNRRAGGGGGGGGGGGRGGRKQSSDWMAGEEDLASEDEMSSTRSSVGSLLSRPEFSGTRGTGGTGGVLGAGARAGGGPGSPVHSNASEFAPPLSLESDAVARRHSGDSNARTGSPLRKRHLTVDIASPNTATLPDPTSASASATPASGFLPSVDGGREGGLKWHSDLGPIASDVASAGGAGSSFERDTGLGGLGDSKAGSERGGGGGGGGFEEESEESEESNGEFASFICEDEVHAPPTLLPPEGVVVTLVDALVLLCGGIEAMVVTYRAAQYQFWTEVSAFEAVFFTVGSIVYLVFAVLHCFTAKLLGWTLVDDSVREVTSLYARTWLVFDVVAGFPFDLLLLGTTPIVFRISSLLRILKLFRTFTLFKTSNPLHERRYKPVIAACWIAVIHHFTACLHMMVKETNRDTGNYIESLYWAVQTTTSVGYGDLVGQDTQQMQILSVIVMIIGSGFYGWFLGNISVYFMSQDHVEQKQKGMRAMVLSLMNRYEVPLSVQKEAFCIYPFIFGEGAQSNFTEILGLFPPYMQAKIGVQVRLKLLRQVPMFRQAEGFILEHLAGKLSRLLLEPDTTIIDIHEVGKEMFFISSGAVEVLVPMGPRREGAFRQIVILRDGSWFGEIAILKETRRTAAVRTVTVCDLFMLTKVDFLNILETYPHSTFARSIKDEVERRIRVLQSTTIPSPSLTKANPSLPAIRIRKSSAPERDNTEECLTPPHLTTPLASPHPADGYKPGNSAILRDACYDLDDIGGLASYALRVAFSLPPPPLSNFLPPPPPHTTSHREESLTDDETSGEIKPGDKAAQGVCPLVLHSYAIHLPPS